MARYSCQRQKVIDMRFVLRDSTGMTSISELFDKIGGPFQMAKISGAGAAAAAKWKERQSIPVRYWPPIVAHCREKRISGVTYEILVQMHCNE